MLPGSKTMQEISAGRNIENLKKVFEKHLPDLSPGEKLRYYFQKMLGKNRGWVMFYLNNPKAILKQFKRKIG
jgi:hypothetical protein